MSSNSDQQQVLGNLTLEIRHLDVTGGDSTLIFVKNNDNNSTLYKLLIDAGAEGSGGARLVAYLNTVGELKESVGVGEANKELPVLDCIVATHYHLDHIEGFTRFGGAGILFRNYMDNGGYTANGNLLAPRHGVGKGVKQTTLFGQYTATIQNNRVDNRPAQRQDIPFIADTADLRAAAPVRIPLGQNTGITLTCYSANGILANGANPLGDQKSARNRDISPNDVSLALVLEWEDFRYFTAGDLSGDPNQQSYYDIESHLVNYLADGPLRDKPVTVLRVSHHGSEHSNQSLLFDRLKPKLIVVSCNTKKKVPSPVFLGRLKTYLDANQNSRVLFVNELLYFQVDERYAAMDAIKDYIVEGNVAFANVPNKGNVVTNMAIKTAHVRRRSGGAVPQNANDDPGFRTFVRDNLEIILGLRPENDAAALIDSQKPKTFRMEYTFWEKDVIINSDNKVLGGFRSQAAQMANWLKKDAEQKKSMGRDYIALHYPELTPLLEDREPEELEAALVEKMMWLFDQSFIMAENTLYGPKQNNLSTDAKETISDLLLLNKYQFHFNRAARVIEQDLYMSDYEGKSWNGRASQYPEPYAGDEGKRKSEIQMSRRDVNTDVNT